MTYHGYDDWSKSVDRRTVAPRWLNLLGKAFYWLCIAGVFALIAWGAIAVITMVGCSLIPTEKGGELKQRESVAGKGTADIARETKIEPSVVTAEMSDGKQSIKIEAPAQQQATVTAAAEMEEKSKQTNEASWFQTIPMFVKLIGMAVGIGLLFLVLKWINSRFVNAAFSAGDALGAGMIHKVRSAAMAANGEEAARLSTLAGDMERERTEWHKS